MSTDEMVLKLRKMQSQIIHGTDFFGQCATRLEALSFCHEVATDIDDRVSPGVKNRAEMIESLNRE